jgi:drug/metabolite transporter (DMT)-like permease
MILGIVGTGIANIVFFKLYRCLHLFCNFSDLFDSGSGFFWGLLDNEMLTSVQFIGAFIILIGVYLSAKKNKTVIN